MALFEDTSTIELYEAQLFVAEHHDAHNNFFSLILPARRNVETSVVDEPLSAVSWHWCADKNSLKRYKAWLSEDQVKSLLDTVSRSGTLSITCYDHRSVTIEFGTMLMRPRIFVPYFPVASLAQERWPGGFDDGLDLDAWYPEQVTLNISPTAEANACRFVENETGFRLASLSDFLCSVVKIHRERPLEHVAFQFNYDRSLQTFRLCGEVEPILRRVILECWEGDEAFQRQIFDLPATEVSCSMLVPFAPTRGGYELYELRPSGWVMTKCRSAHFIRKIDLALEVKSGVIRVPTAKGDAEEHDIIVTRLNQTIKRDALAQPWLEAEELRKCINAGSVLRELGSIFVRADDGSAFQLQTMIRERIFDSARESIQVWDAYLDASVLDSFILLGCQRPVMKIQLLLSEWTGERVEKSSIAPISDADSSADHRPQDDTALAMIQEMPRCWAIYQRLNHSSEAYVRLKQQRNLQIRNWYRSGTHAFHDRFLIIDHTAVWHIGSSLKDLGNYHTTLYRLDQELGKQVAREFDQSWNGHIGRLHPNGIQVFPDVKSLGEVP